MGDHSLEAPTARSLQLRVLVLMLQSSFCLVKLTTLFPSPGFSKEMHLLKSLKRERTAQHV